MNVFRLLGRGTVESRINELQETKQMTIDGVHKEKAYAESMNLKYLIPKLFGNKDASAPFIRKRERDKKDEPVAPPPG